LESEFNNLTLIKPGEVLKFEPFKKSKRFKGVKDKYGNLIHPKNLNNRGKRIHAGTGVIFVDKQAGEIILVKDCKGYTSAGGKIEGLEVIDCAIKECYEETRTMIKLTREILEKSKIYDMDHFGYNSYRVYFVEVNGKDQPKVNCKDFYKIDVSKMPREYQETNEIDRFKIKDLQYVNKNKISVKQTTVDGNEIELRGRTVTILKCAKKILHSFI
jgi:8-oxo-dGTP pyrophosphatase MutT (NUDIX family)